MTTYLALLRGINVGGNSLIKMTELKEALMVGGLTDVRTYIQSGNVIFSSQVTDASKLAKQITSCIKETFKLEVPVVVFSSKQWQSIIAQAPSWWGKDILWKHNILVLVEPLNIEDVVEGIGALKPDIEAMLPGKGVLYQSVSFKFFGRTAASKLLGNPMYKKMTIRNFNTATKLATLLTQ